MVTITLYDREDQPIRRYAAIRVSWRLVKVAIEIRQRLAEGALNEDQQAVLRALLVEAFGGQFDVARLEQGASVDEMGTTAVQIATQYGALMGLKPAEVEKLLVSKMGWSLRAIDETDAESLKGFFRELPKAPVKKKPAPETKTRAGSPVSKRTRQVGQKFADEVSWL